MKGMPMITARGFCCSTPIGRAETPGRVGRARAVIVAMFFFGPASCTVTASARLPPTPCVEPVEVVDQVDNGVAVLVGRDEADVRTVPAGRWVEGMVLSGGRPAPICGLWLRRHTRALMRRVRRGHP